MKPELSVVIPTHDRAKRLRETLESLIHQSLGEELFEILIIDDGSVDGTNKMVADLGRRAKHKIRYYWQENKFAGAARNLGIMEARAPIVLLLDDDIVTNRDHLKFHLDLHLKYPAPEAAVRGRITPGPKSIDLLRWGESDIFPIGYAADGDAIISSGYFVTADVSLKKDFLIRAGLFNPGLPAVQDTDLAWRLHNLGMKLIYCRQAEAIHTEPIDSVEKLIINGKKYGRTLADWYGRIPIYQDEIWRLGARLNGGWNHFSRHPWGFLKDAFRRWTINRYTIDAILYIVSKIPITNPPKEILRRLCKEIWAYYYRHEFQQRRRQLDKENRGPPTG